MTDPGETYALTGAAVVVGAYWFRKGMADHLVGRLEVKGEKEVADAWETMYVRHSVVGPGALEVRAPMMGFVEVVTVNES